MNNCVTCYLPMVSGGLFRAPGEWEATYINFDYEHTSTPHAFSKEDILPSIQDDDGNYVALFLDKEKALQRMERLRDTAINDSEYALFRVNFRKVE